MARGGGNKGAGTPGKPAQKKGNNNNEDVRRDTPLQAIVFADSFTETFRPITLTMPKVLLPLANVPMLEYTLEFLVSSGVQEVILFCTHHLEEIEQFLKTQSQVAKRVSVQCVYSSTTLTAGDALREIDRQQLIQSDPFILMSGDVVANVNLPSIIEEHQARKKKDPNCIMTSVFKEIPPNFATSIRPLNDQLIVGLDNLTSQIVLYENDSQHKSTHLETVFLDEHAQITLRSDLMDCFIDICAPEVLLKFAEDFDYQDLRRDFFHNEVQNYELGKKFFVKIVTDEFAARVMDPRTYGGISRAILQRWVFPMVPDNNYLGSDSTNYTYHRGMVYKDDNVTLSRTCAVQRESILGAGTTCGDHTTITKSAIGRNCTIGKNVHIEGSFLWSNVVIEDNVVIKNAIVCDNVIIRAGAVIEEGSVLSFGVVIGAGYHLKAFSKVTTAEKQEADDGFSSDEDGDDEDGGEQSKAQRSSSIVNGEWNPKHVGAGGVGRVWTLDEDGIEVDSDDEGDEEDEANSFDTEARRLLKLKSLMLGAPDVVAAHAQQWDKWETLSRSDESSTGSVEEDDADGVDPSVKFIAVIRDMVVSGDSAGHDPDDSFMEIKSYKFSQNLSFATVINGIIPGLLDRVPTQGLDKMALLGQMHGKFRKWSSVLKRCLVEDGDPSAVVEALEAACLSDEHRTTWSPLFRFLLQTVHDMEFVSEEVVLEWHESRVGGDHGAAAKELASSKDVLEFIEWLQEEEESDEDDDDDDGEESEEDED
ncbi:hypothetical protein Poli38472_011356 [Pythium oligandrum]|uniref:Translation initiation factor eIF2B subunit epsilon n=1 Tax=Pythium oligandrum TaxID=41045 RepID=A0A8K1CIZ5_PYTOL|nr:hypothetical protein Poli38472_011356 [Pythium oligandrum]|eukprot:TMW64476.1 hypothetical protein Poli38472_011356 [Pythium oligandrum]